MLVQFEMTIKRSELVVMLGRLRLSRRARRPDIGRKRRAKPKVQPLQANKLSKARLLAKGIGRRFLKLARKKMFATTAMRRDIGKGAALFHASIQGMFVVEIIRVANSASWVLDIDCSAHICNDLQVMARSRRLSKGEVDLRLGNGKRVAIEVVRLVHLVVSDHVRIDLKECYYVPRMIQNIISIPILDNEGYEFSIIQNCFYLLNNDSSHLSSKLINGLYIIPQYNTIMTVQNKCKLDNHENSQILYARLGHISQDRIRKLVDSKSLEIDDLDNPLACESCLKGKMTKKPFIGKNRLSSDLLDLTYSDICGPFITQARRGFTYFITCTDDHSRYAYVYSMKCKSEAFEKFKQFRFDIKN
ncbi:UNVERIFIED_CONTAM: Retrovirus-related Pol polyprotein from transposon TNT 1-94 [Sesamum angustifolium]|uniref:Retrovirus-related Pol polyprotein from transposon TNT 1-94 n=1 Tax=Sesamum angustifolium TaxID=2727405 RepID=A0AAW2JEF2_9LAMI